MEVRLNDFGRRWAAIGRNAMAAMERVGASGSYILGDQVAGFEHDLGAWWPAAHVIAVGNGLDAIEIGLRCLGVGSGDKVLTTPLSAFATTLAILRVGASPVFVDVDDSGLLDLERCRERLQSDPSLRCLLPVHLYGRSLDLDGLDALRAEFDLRLLEDCAQSIGAHWGGRSTGTAGQMAATSFYPTKNLGALGDGGAVLTASSDLAARARALRHYGQTATYRHDHIGLNSRLDELHAAVLKDVLLPRLEEWTESRRRIAAMLRHGIVHTAVELPIVPPDSDPCWHLFPVLVAPERRGDFVEHLRSRGIETAAHYPLLIPEQRAMAEYGRFEVVGDLSRARRFAAGEVSLPMHPFLTDAEVAHVIAACNEWRSA